MGRQVRPFFGIVVPDSLLRSDVQMSVEQYAARGDEHMRECLSRFNGRARTNEMVRELADAVVSVLEFSMAGACVNARMQTAEMVVRQVLAQ